MKSLIAAIALAISGIAPPTFAQVYPSHPITIVVPFAAGGPTDVIARTMAQHMRASLGQSVIVENVTGANGNIGVGGLRARRLMATRSVSATGAPTWSMERSIRSRTTC